MTIAGGDLAVLVSTLEWPDAEAAATARATADPATGRLAELTEWLASCLAPRTAPARPVLVTVGPSSSRAEGVATAVGARVHALEVDDATPVPAAIDAGRAAADAEAESGTDVLLLAAGPGGRGAAVVASLLTGVEPVALLPRGAEAADAAAWIEAATALRDTRHRVAPLRRDVPELLTAVGDAVLAAAAGVVLGAVARRTPLVLDGVTALVAGLVAYDLSARSSRWWQPADTGGGPVAAAVVEHTARRPLLDLATRTGDGTAALLTLPLLHAATGGGPAGPPEDHP